MHTANQPAAQPSVAAGEYDWLATWRDMYDRERAQAEQFPAPGPGSDCWAGQAARFAAAAERGQQPDGFMRFVAAPRPHRSRSTLARAAGATSRRSPPQWRKFTRLSPRRRCASTWRRAWPQPGWRMHVHAASWLAESIPPCDGDRGDVLYGVRDAGRFCAPYAAARRAAVLRSATRRLSVVLAASAREARLPLPARSNA